MMCNEKTIPKKGDIQENDYRFIDYRLTQLENNLRQGQERLEQEYKEANKQILETLKLMQENNNEINKSIIELAQRQSATENRINNLDLLKETATKNRTEINEIERRLDIYKQILFLIGGTAVTSLMMAIFQLILK